MTTTLSAPDPAGAPPRSPAAEALLARLDDPRTAAGLNGLLDNIELLSMMVTMVDELLRRSETIVGNLSGGLAELREAAGEAGSGEVQAALTDLRAVLPVLHKALPTLQALLASTLATPATIHSIDTVAAALVTGLAEGPAATERTGVRALLHQLRDPATTRGLTVLLGVAKALGREPAA